MVVVEYQSKVDVAVFRARLSVQCPDMVEILMNERNITLTLVPEFLCNQLSHCHELVSVAYPCLQS